MMIKLNAVAYMEPALFELINARIHNEIKDFCVFTNTYPPDDQWNETIAGMGVIDLIVFDYGLYAEIPDKEGWLEKLTKALFDLLGIMPLVVNYIHEDEFDRLADGLIAFQDSLLQKNIPIAYSEIDEGDEFLMEIAARNLILDMRDNHDLKEEYAHLYAKSEETKSAIINIEEDDPVIKPLEQYKKPIELGAGLVHKDPKAMFELGLALQDGDGVPKDEEEAFCLFRESAELEYPPAMYMYAVCWAEGKVCEKNLNEAQLWALMAMEAGYPDQGLLDVIREEMKKAGDGS